MGLSDGFARPTPLVPARRAFVGSTLVLIHDLTVVAISFRPSGPGIFMFL
jgi:hypothetical protein